MSRPESILRKNSRKFSPEGIRYLRQRTQFGSHPFQGGSIPSLEENQGMGGTVPVDLHPRRIILLPVDHDGVFRPLQSADQGFVSMTRTVVECLVVLQSEKNLMPPRALQSHVEISVKRPGTGCLASPNDRNDDGNYSHKYPGSDQKAFHVDGGNSHSGGLLAKPQRWPSPNRSCVSETTRRNGEL